MQVTLTYVKNEQKVAKKSGKTYTSCSIKTEEHGEVWLNGFGNEITKSWVQGDKVDIEVQKEEFEGKTYVNFKTMNKADLLDDRVTALEKTMKLVVEKLRGDSQSKMELPTKPVKAKEVTTEEVDTGLEVPDDLPF